MRTVLIVDDSILSVRIIKSYLEEILGEDIELLSAANGEEAIAQYGAKSPDVVFLDITMPGIDGLEVLRRLKKLDSHARVVMVSVQSDPETVETASREGAIDFIFKPFRKENFKKVIEEHFMD